MLTYVDIPFPLTFQEPNHSSYVKVPFKIKEKMPSEHGQRRFFFQLFTARKSDTVILGLNF